MIKFLSQVFCIVVFLFTTSFAADSNQSHFIVAKVNSKAITKLDLIDRYNSVLLLSKIKIKSREDRQLLLGQILDKMIDEELILQEAKNLKMEVSNDQIRDAVEIMALHQKKNATQFKFLFNKKGISFDNYLRQVEAELLWSKIISEGLRSKVKISEVEVREFFEQQKFETDLKKFHIAEILISKFSDNAEKLAQKLVVELRNGADFDNIVKQFSQSISAENNGDLGWVFHNEIDQKIYDVIFKLRKNGYSEPVLLADGYHIFKLLDMRIEHKISDEDLKQARNAIFVKKLQTVAKGYMMDLRKHSFVEKKSVLNF